MTSKAVWKRRELVTDNVIQTEPRNPNEYFILRRNSVCTFLLFSHSPSSSQVEGIAMVPKQGIASESLCVCEIEIVALKSRFSGF